MNGAIGSNKVVLGLWLKGVAEGGGKKEEMVDVEEKDARDISMVETKAATSTVNKTKIETKMGAQATNDWSDPAQLCKIIWVNDCNGGDKSQTQRRQSVLVTAMQRQRRDWHQLYANKIRKRKSIWKVIWSCSGMGVDQQNDLCTGANVDVIATHATMRGETIMRIMNV